MSEPALCRGLNKPFGKVSYQENYWQGYQPYPPRGQEHSWAGLALGSVHSTVDTDAVVDVVLAVNGAGDVEFEKFK